MIDASQIVAAFNDVATTKSLTHEEVQELLRDGIMAGLARLPGPTVHAEVTIDHPTGGSGSVVLRRVRAVEVWWAGAPSSIPRSPAARPA